MLDGFGKRLKDSREQAGYSHKELSEATGISFSSLRAYERIIDSDSRGKPPIDTTMVLADQLNVSLDYLCRGRGEIIKEGNAVPILRALTGVIETLRPYIEIEKVPGDYVDGIGCATLVFRNGEPSSSIPADDPQGKFIDQLQKILNCGLKDIDEGIYDKTIDALIQQWDCYNICDGKLRLSKRGQSTSTGDERGLTADAAVPK